MYSEYDWVLQCAICGFHFESETQYSNSTTIDGANAKLCSEKCIKRFVQKNHHGSKYTFRSEKDELNSDYFAKRTK